MKAVGKYFICILILINVVSCKPTATNTLFSLEQNTCITFNNEVRDSKDENSFYFRNFYNGGGVALGDINNDGYPDVFLTSNMGENKLYLNTTKQAGEIKFEDITAKSGMQQDSMWSTGAVMVDINHDGWLDIYVCNSGHMKSGHRKNKLYINNHDLTFTEEASKYGLDISAYTTQVSFFDYDLDGDLDCFMINNSPIPFGSLNYANMRDLAEADWKVDPHLKGGGNRLFRNDNGHFVDATAQSGIHTSLISFGLGVSVCDINNDGYPDVYVGNDFIERDYLYINQKNGTFKDELEQWLPHISMSSMSTDLADINNDGYPEIYTTDMIAEDDYRLKTTGVFDNIDLYRSKVKAGFYQQFVRNCLQLNNKSGGFCDIANFSGVAATDWSWGSLMLDLDNDGLNDIYVCNGVNRDVGSLDFLDFFSNDVYRKMVETGRQQEVFEILKNIPSTPLENKVYRNLGDLHFQDVGRSWGFTQKSFSNSVAYADLDNDGDLDLVVNNENQEAFVYRNHSREENGNSYVSLQLKGQGENTFAIGSKIRVYKGGEVFYRELVPSRGFQSSVDYKVVIGLGKNTSVDSMTVTWPGGMVSRYEHPAINKLYALDESREKKEKGVEVNSKVSPLVDSVQNNFDRHREDDYVDFYYERNIPEMLSREGPRGAVGDVNGDGLEDIYIGGARGQGGSLYEQQRDGRFIKKEEPSFKQFMDFEDVAVTFFDADGDGDLDLFVGAGGNASAAGSRELQHRLYRNDGKGNFQIDVNAFGPNESNVGAVVAADFDGDGDVDLFVGGRSVPQNYGLSPRSYVYINDGKGKFTDMAEKMNPDIATIGMVTGAAWADVLGNGRKQLIIVGEWMSPRVFSFEGGKCKEEKTNLSEMKGWWQTVAVSDVDGDGRQDVILGNIGENFYLHPTQQEPVKLWMNDFDQNGTIDKILSRSVGGRDVPVFLKRDLEEQLPVLKKQNLHHKDYATKSVGELFSAEVMGRSVEKEFTYAGSCIAWNEGGGKFTVEKLPAMSEMSSVHAVLVEDVNGDGRKDVLLGGNTYGFPPQFGRLDGSYGDVLLNEGGRKLKWTEPVKSGILVKGEVRDIKEISKAGGEKMIVYLVNDDYPKAFALRRTNIQITTKSQISNPK